MQQVPLNHVPIENYHALKEQTKMTQFGTLHLPLPQCI